MSVLRVPQIFWFQPRNLRRTPIHLMKHIKPGPKRVHPVQIGQMYGTSIIVNLLHSQAKSPMDDGKAVVGCSYAMTIVHISNEYL